MTQTLLAFRDAPAERARVSGRIASHVAHFCNVRIGDGTWFISDLVAYVAAQTQTAPASPDRILRDLRQRGLLNYEVVNRSKSEYRSLRT